MDYYIIKKRLLHKLHSDSGFSLPYILLIIFLITGILLAAISLFLFYNQQVVKEINRKKLELACYSAVQEYMVKVKKFSTGEYITTIDSVNVLITHRLKGLFPEITATASNYRDSAKVVYHLASKSIPAFDNAIIISRPNLNVSYAGQNRIKGSILSGTSKLTPGHIFGLEVSEKYLSCPVMVSRDIKQKMFADTLLKSLSDYMADEDIGRFKGKFILDSENLLKLSANTSFFIDGDLIIRGTIKGSFTGAIYCFKVSGRTMVENNTECNLNIEIYSDSSVIFTGGSNIENMLIYSNRDIEVLSGNSFKNVQFLSGRNISIKDSRFNYPSVILAYSRSESTDYEIKKINIESGIVNGTVMHVSSFTGFGNINNTIRIDKNSKVKGAIYSENYVEIEGEVIGTVYTHDFYFYNEPSTYINWLVNLNINREELDESFLMPCGFSEKPDLEILSERWFY